MQLQGQDGLVTTYRQGWRRRGVLAWFIALGLTGFYCALYWTDLFNPVAELLGLGSKWFLYGALYCVAMLVGGAMYLRSHGNSRYNRIRITVNVVVQVLLGFSLPFVMQLFGGKDYYFSYLWPLKIDYLYPQTLESLPLYLAVYSVVAALVLAPIMALAFGKRWYCSWVCGCGGLANTFGDPWRHLSNKGRRAWRFEKISIHAVLIIALATTALMAVDFFLGDRAGALHAVAGEVKGSYGFVVGAVLAGVVGVGFYPLLGPRVWCRFFCPMAAMLGLLQKLGRFQITVKPDMCISCGNCSAYCEMGIDVRAYAQSNESFTRASCVGCGMCAHMCPRGVLRLENLTRRRAS